jgi:tRNA nucleotidyltransferase (CCA-adding enzyme)
MYSFAASDSLRLRVTTSGSWHGLKPGLRTAEAGKKMPDYIYLLENRLSSDQKNALRLMREAAREAEMILFLTGDAVRDLSSGHAVRDLEIVVHGNALKLKKRIESLGGIVWGEDETTRSLYLCFPGTVRIDVVSAHSAEYPKPGQAVIHPASIQEDLRRRDFTVNAMAISLNEGSFGLLMDPLNGAADIESRTLRLVSNYGFLDEPSLLIRAIRYQSRLDWEMDPRTRTRYENAKEAEVIQFLSPLERSRELEQIGHEDYGLKVLRALESEGWMNFLFPSWTEAKADEEKLKALYDLAVELLLQGVQPDMSAAQMELLTSKMAPKELAALKKLMLRPGFVAEWNSLDALASGFSKTLLSKENAVPSSCYKLFHQYDPEAILWLGFTSKNETVRERFNQFLKIWPEERQHIPYSLMQEMRINPDLPTYDEIVQGIFLELIDGRLTTTEEIRAFLEPYSPPAPVQQAPVKRPRVKRGAEAKIKEQSFDEEEEPEEGLEEEEDLDDLGVDLGGEEEEEDVDLGLSAPAAAQADDLEEEESEEEEVKAAPVKRSSNKAAAAAAIPDKAKAEKATAKPAPPAVIEKAAPAHKAVAAAVPKKAVKAEAAPKPKVAVKQKPEHKAEAKPKPAAKTKAVEKPKAEAKAKPTPAAKSKPKPVATKPAAAAKPKPKAAKPVAKAPARKPAKAPVKAAVKAAAKPVAKATPKHTAKAAPAKGKPAHAPSPKAGSAAHKGLKAALKGTAHKPVKKR